MRPLPDSRCHSRRSGCNKLRPYKLLQFSPRVLRASARAFDSSDSSKKSDSSDSKLWQCLFFAEVFEGGVFEVAVFLQARAEDVGPLRRYHLQIHIAVVAHNETVNVVKRLRPTGI